MGLNLYVSGNTLQARVQEYAVKVYLKDEALTAITAQLYGADGKSGKLFALASAERQEGVMGQEAYCNALRTEIEGLYEKKEAIQKDDQYKFDWSTPEDKALVKAWKATDRKDVRAEAVAKWVNSHGFNVQWRDVLRLVEVFDGKTGNSIKGKALGESFNKSRGFSKKLFWNELVDMYMEAGLIKKDVIPVALTEYWETRMKLVKEAKEAKKAEKAALRKAGKKDNK